MIFHGDFWVQISHDSLEVFEVCVFIKQGRFQHDCSHQ